MEQALCFLKKWATFDGRLAALQEHTTKRLPAAFSALCVPMKQLGTICPHNGASVTNTTKSSPSMEEKHHPTGGQVLNYNGVPLDSRYLNQLLPPPLRAL